MSHKRPRTLQDSEPSDRATKRRRTRDVPAEPPLPRPYSTCATFSVRTAAFNAVPTTTPADLAPSLFKWRLPSTFSSQAQSTKTLRPGLAPSLFAAERAATVDAAPESAVAVAAEVPAVAAVLSDAAPMETDVHAVNKTARDVPVVSIRVCKDVDAIPYDLLPWDDLPPECVRIAMQAHRVRRTGLRTQERELHIARQHSCDSICRDIRFKLTSEQPELLSADCERVQQLCERIISAVEHNEPFPPIYTLPNERRVICEWLSRLSDDRFSLKTCACCSGLVLPATCTSRQLDEVHLLILTNPALPDHLFPVGYDGRLVYGALLDKDGIVSCRPQCVVIICDPCWSSVKRLKLPALSLANDNYTAWDNVPDNIQLLFQRATPVELSLIARNRVRCTIFKFTSQKASVDDAESTSRYYPAQSYGKGNVMTFTNGNIDLLDVLPPGPDLLQATMSVIFVGKVLPPPEELDRLTPLLVRRHVVVPLLKWLIQNDPEYSDMVYSPANMDALLPGKDSGVPCGLHLHLVTQSGTEDPGAPTVPGEELETPDISQIPVASLGVVSRTFEQDTVRQQKLASMMMWKRKGATAWAIGHGATPVSEWDNPSFFPRAFPHLFPFGIGGLDDRSRRTPIPFEEHVRHLLNLASRKFATDHAFQFVAMNIAQRRRVSQSVKWQVGRAFWRPAHDFLAEVNTETISRMRERAARAKGVVQAEDDEEKKVLNFLHLLKNVPITIPGSPAAKKKERNEIRSTMHRRGLPGLFITLNTADMYHPLFLKLAGLHVNLDERIQTAFPTAYQRAYHVGKNPTAAAQFFDAMIQVFIDVVLGMGNGGQGLFGKVTAYYGTVETQGRGSLHAHFLVWLAGSLPPQLLRDRMQSDEQFKLALFDWLHSIIATQTPTDTGVVSPQQAKRMHRARGAPHSGTMKCPHPDDSDFDVEWTKQLQQVTYESHYHTHNKTCWKYLKPGQIPDPALCRMRMNGETRAETVLDASTGSILLRRWHPDINQHNPVLSMLARCNNDVKFIGSGEAAKALTYYVTDYITKDNLPTDEAFAALTKLVERVRNPEYKDPSYIVGQKESYDPVEHGVRFLSRACNALMACREVSGQEVALFFHKRGKSDHYTSEIFTTIIWGGVWRWVAAQAKEKEKELERDHASIPGPTCENSHPASPSSLENSPGNLDDGETVEFDGSKRPPSTQLDDYRFRGRALEHLGMYWFYSCTATTTVSRERIRQGVTVSENSRSMPRVPFLEGHPNYATKVVRLRERAAVPCIVGPTLPRKDRPDQYSDYCKAMLLLFKPWRAVEDLLGGYNSWEDAFGSYEFDPHSLGVMQNFAAAHECKDASDAYRELRRNGVVFHDLISAEVFDKALASARREGDEDLSEWLNEHHPALMGLVADADSEGGSTEQYDDGEVILSRLSVQRAQRAKEAVDTALAKIGTSQVVSETLVDSAEIACDKALRDLQEYKKQTTQLKAQLPMWTNGGHDDQDEDDQNDCEDEHAHVHAWFVDPERVRPAKVSSDTVSQADFANTAREIADRLGFNREQRAAFGIVVEHRLTLSLEQLVMFVVGSGGTGKSHVVRGWDDFFAAVGALSEFKKAAPTGIASFIIRAETLHALLKLHILHLNSETLELLQETWRHVRYLVIDEISMVGARMLGKISQRLQLILGSDAPFGGISVIFVGDPRQLPPVGDKATWSEPGDSDPSSATLQGQLLNYGRSLWGKLTHVVVLRQNYRQKKDPLYQSIITRVAQGAGLVADCDTLRRRLLGVSAMTAEFVEAPLITADKTVRDDWNRRAVKRFSTRTGQLYAEYVAIDRAYGRLLPEKDRARVLQRSSSETGDRLGKLPLVLGMRVMILSNIVTRGGVVNGAEGVVERIMYNTSPSGDRYLLCVLVRVEGAILQYPGLELGVVPVFPDAKYFKVRRRDQSTMNVVRYQVPLLPAYAYTDYKSQGRTLTYAILDLASAKRRESLYVMLSRVISLENVLILRRFQNTFITSQLSVEAAKTLRAIEKQDSATLRRWKASQLERYLTSAAAS